MALAYDPRSRTTSGVVCLQQGDLVPEAIFLNFFQALEDVKAQVTNPLLVPILLYGRWVALLGANYHQAADSIRMNLRPVLSKAGLDFDRSCEATTRIPGREEFDQLHREIVRQHRGLTGATADFVSILGEANLKALTKVEQFRTRHNVEIGHDDDPDDLCYYVKHMQMKTQVEIQHRDRLLRRLTMYLQVVSKDL